MTKILSNFVFVVVVIVGLLSFRGAGFAQAIQNSKAGVGGKQSAREPAVAMFDEDVEPGTVMVWVVAGSKTAPLAGIEVTLHGSLGIWKERTGVDGSARFAVNADPDRQQIFNVEATVGDVPMVSEKFGASVTSGVSVLLSTTPIGPGRGGRPSAKMMSGRVRPEVNDPSGRLTIRAISGELEQSQWGGLSADIPTGALIHLVGVDADGGMTVQTETVLAEKEGRVVFDQLKRDNSVAYYAMTTFSRPGGTDRLMTQALRMAPQTGSRMMFAGAPTQSAAPGIDTLLTLAGVDVASPTAGTVLVRVFAENSQSEAFHKVSSVELIDIRSPGASQKTATAQGAPGASAIVGQSGVMKVIDGTENGEVSFYAARPSTDMPIPGVEIRVERVDKARMKNKRGGSAALPASISTDEKGVAYFRELVLGDEYVAIASLYGKEVRSETFTPSANNALSFAFAFQWSDQQVLQARFDGVSSDAKSVYIAKVVSNGRAFFSVPFQMTAERGAAVGIYMYPEVLFSFHGGAQLDDKRLWFQVRMTVANPGIAPFRLRDGDLRGLPIALPKGFLGASVADEMASQIGIEPGEGLLWRGAVPPGQRDFIVGFALPVELGAMRFDMDLPYGLRGGRVVVDDIAGMELRNPGGTRVNAKTNPNGSKYLEMADLHVEPRQRFVFGIRGLPQHSRWHSRARTGVGMVALAFFLWAGYVVFFDRKSAAASDPILVGLEASREKLLEQLAALETEYRHRSVVDEDKPYKKRRERLNSRLIAVYREIDAHKSGTRSAN